MSLINQLLDIKSNKDLQFVYIFKIELHNGNKTKVVYTIGHTKDDHAITLQELLLSHYYDADYFPRAKILRMEQIADYDQITKELQYELLDNLVYFKKLTFKGSKQMYSIDEKELLTIYHKYISDTHNVELIEMMPKWSLSDSELKELVDTSLDMTEQYYAVKVL